MSEELTAAEAIAQAWASIDGKLGKFMTCKADRSFDSVDGTYSGYMDDAQSMIERLETRGYAVVRIGERS